MLSAVCTNSCVVSVCVACICILTAGQEYMDVIKYDKNLHENYEWRREREREREVMRVFSYFDIYWSIQPHMHAILCRFIVQTWKIERFDLIECWTRSEQRLMSVSAIMAFRTDRVLNQLILRTVRGQRPFPFRVQTSPWSRNYCFELKSNGHCDVHRA